MITFSHSYISIQKILGLSLFILTLMLGGCSGSGDVAVEEDAPLPVLKDKDIAVRMVDGQRVVDTLNQAIPNFHFWDQDSSLISKKDVEGKVYVADFFFSHCPTICHVMKKQMYRIYQEFEQDDRVVLLSHSIDPERDSVKRLKVYADRLGDLNSSKWHFMTGNRDSLYWMTEKYWERLPTPDAKIPGNISHDGKLHLVDQQGRLRGRQEKIKDQDGNIHYRIGYDGTDPKSVDKLIRDIHWLLAHPDGE